MLPANLIIRCPDLQDIESLFALLEAEGVRWGSFKTPLANVEIDFICYAEHKRDVLCFSLQDGRMGYCWEKWFREHDPYCRYPFVNAEDLLYPHVEEEPITGLTDLL